MPFGIQVYNSDNYLAITEEYSNYRLVSTGTGNNSTPNPLTGNQIAVFSGINGANIFPKNPGLNNWCTSANNAGFNYAILEPATGAQGGVGLAVYGASGETQFNSNNRYVTPVYQFSQFSTSSSWSPVALSLPALTNGARSRYVTLGIIVANAPIGPSNGTWIGSYTGFSSTTSATVGEAGFANTLRLDFYAGYNKYWLFVDV